MAMGSRMMLAWQYNAEYLYAEDDWESPNHLPHTWS